MNEKEFFRCKKLGIPYLKSIQVTQHDRYVPKPMPKIRDRPFGNHVGKEGGNPEYKKTVIQLERERIEKEKQELILKRKRNSNYIQQCIKHGNEYYNDQKVNSLAWLKKDK